MRWSRYNYMFNSKKFGHLLYNSFTNTFVEFDENTYKEVDEIRKNAQDYDYTNNPQLMLQLLSGKFLIEDDEQPQLQMEMKNTLMRFSPRNLSLTIAPTRDCNFECPYCYEEDRPKLYMSNETEENLIKFIQKYKNFNSLNITWYGGEPLLCWDQILRISKKINGITDKYFSEIITNGYLLDEKVANDLDKAAIEAVQITIDGMQETHNKRRKHKNDKDTFNKILKNLDYLLKVWHGKLAIRINVDKTNHEEYHRVHDLIKSRFKDVRSKIIIYPGIVMDYSKDCISNGSCGLNKNDTADFMFECYKKYNIDDLNFFPYENNGTCTATMLHSYLVGPEGELYKCWRDLGKKDMIVGSIDGSIPTNNNIISRYLVGVNPYTSKKCKNCFYLPVCNGGCPNLRYRNKYEDTDFETCLFHKGNLDTFLEAHYEIRRNKKRVD